ncbi:hypothetical protein bcgnr5372_37410 [Bacillus luti]|nr:hypothetical protein [Bacillus cereus]HDR8330033.1 hypothetical protein [Bacillus cereus]HDR8337255.1 hypothetical protein [Bacillus cereus]
MEYNLFTAQGDILDRYYPPKGEFVRFESEEHYIQKGQEWGLFDKNPKEQFLYKRDGKTYYVTIKGYEEYGENGSSNTLVIEFEDGNLSCILPSYLDSMQSASFGNDSDVAEDQDEAPKKPAKKPKTKKTSHKEKETTADVPKPNNGSVKKPVTTGDKKVTLPEDKVGFTALVKAFDTVPNPFSSSNPETEVIIFEKITMNTDPITELDYAWCGYSNTLKKVDLQVGDALDFQAKVVKKKINKKLDIDVLYKINNPSKLLKK